MDNSNINNFMDSAEHRKVQQTAALGIGHKGSITRRDGHGGGFGGGGANAAVSTVFSGENKQGGLG